MKKTHSSFELLISVIFFLFAVQVSGIRLNRTLTVIFLRQLFEPITSWSPAFSRALASLVVFIRSSSRLFSFRLNQWPLWLLCFWFNNTQLKSALTHGIIILTWMNLGQTFPPISVEAEQTWGDSSLVFIWNSTDCKSRPIPVPVAFT